MLFKKPATATKQLLTHEDVTCAWDAYRDKCALADYLIQYGLPPEMAEIAKKIALSRFEIIYHEFNDQ